MSERPAVVHEIELDVGGRPVRVLRAGAGEPIVLVHGLGLSADFWRYHLQRLARAGYDAIAPDMPGFGRSTGPAFGFSVEQAAGWLADFARAAGIDRPVWVGHSVSAQYVLRLAVACPERVRALVLAAPTGEPGAFRWAAQLAGLAVTAFRERPRFVGHVLAAYLTTPPNRAIGSWLRARGHHALEDAPRIRCPLRVVHGERDPVVPRPFAEQLAALAPRGSLVSIPGSAHGVALAPAEPFCAALLDFLATLSPQLAVDSTPSGRGKNVETA